MLCAVVQQVGIEFGRVPACKDGGEEVEDAVYPGDGEDALEEARLPRFREEPEEEETQRYL